MAVKIVLVTDGVEKPDTAGRIAQQRIRELIEGTYLGLIAKTTDINYHSFTVVVIMYNRMEVMLSGILRILMDALVFVSGELGK
jgi:hypothetical protein